VPCIACNQSVKFVDLMTVARDLGADVLATGHYVQTRLGADGRRELFRPVDNDRDQSYFLFATTQDQLDFLRFPLGGMSKPQVRELAREFGLEIAEKHDSQDICFVPQGKYADIIARMHPEALAQGEIVHMDGRVLGTHEGIVHYTIGQRKGLGICRGRAALCGQAGSSHRPRHRRPARGAEDPHRAPARRELAGCQAFG
jgi:tRNA-specific 2-thiouridylase